MRIITLVICILMCFSATAQQSSARADLERRKQAILESIRQTERELEATKKDKKATLGQLRALQNKLADRQRLIGNINEQIGEINNNIQTSSKEVVQLKGNLEMLKTRYAQSLRYSYANRSSYDMLAFLFSSRDFNDALRRVKYLKKYRDYRKDQVEQIRVTQAKIEHKIGVLNTEKAQKDELLSAQEQQKQVLQKETNETDQVVKELKGREKDLMVQVEKNRKASRQLDKAIGDMIRREIEIARKKAEEEQRRRAEEERRLAAAKSNSGGMNVNTGSGRNPNSNNNGNSNNTGTTHPRTNNSSNNNSGAVATTAHPRSTPARPSYDLSLTPEAAALSNSFEANRGRLPWPVDKGFISERFGVHPHPVEKKVMIENNGVDIRTSAGATARAVFDGTVTNVFAIPGAGWNVLITHGHYFTVYGNLENVRVKKGDFVHTKQPLGTVGTTDDGDNIVKFQVWKGSSKMDPEGWIAR